MAGRRRRRLRRRMCCVQHEPCDRSTPAVVAGPRYAPPLHPHALGGSCVAIDSCQSLAPAGPGPARDGKRGPAAQLGVPRSGEGRWIEEVAFRATEGQAHRGQCTRGETRRRRRRSAQQPCASTRSLKSQPVSCLQGCKKAFSELWKLRAHYRAPAKAPAGKQATGWWVLVPLGAGTTTTSPPCPKPSLPS